MVLLPFTISGKKTINLLLKIKSQWISILMQFGIFNGSVKEKEIREKA